MAAITIHKQYSIVISVMVLALGLACGTSATQTQSPTPIPESATLETPTIPDLSQLSLSERFEDLSFGRLTNLVQAGDRFYVTEQTGRVITFPTDLGNRDANVFLDLREQVSTAGNEEGLLGLAFDPGFESNGRLYVYYSAANPRRSVVSRFTAAGGDRSKGEPGSELVVMEIPQPFQNHNGGQLAFGPDRMLYISLGDGGLGGDPMGNGQNLATLLGSILRIDVSEFGPDEPYRIPSDNPFVDTPNAKGEIWAYGFRNPWRFSFDRLTGGLWAGDVGQNAFEEVDRVEQGENYGWNTLEGRHCFSPRSNCDPSGTVLPVIEYGSDQGCSVIGGYVYRGNQIPDLAGIYLYGDFCSGEIYGFRVGAVEATEPELLIKSGFKITSFGEDIDGEIYVLSLDGSIYALTAASP